MVKNIVKGKEVDISTYKVTAKKGAKGWYLATIQKGTQTGTNGHRKAN